MKRDTDRVLTDAELQKRFVCRGSGTCPNRPKYMSAGGPVCGVHGQPPKKKNLTDRARRYRANRNPPPGRRQCNLCGSRKNVDIDHIDGNEDHGEAWNLMYACRPCNVAKGITQSRNRIGRRTEQYNPTRGAHSLKEWRQAAGIVTGLTAGPVGLATSLLQNTSPAQRAKYGEAIAKNPTPTFQQYGFAVAHHQRGRHDEGGEIIHATPPAIRSQYAERIAEIKRGRRGDVPF